MADLTNLESKLGEATGLAMAAQVATGRVITLAKEEDAEIAAALEKMREEAPETERRCTDLAGTFEGMKTAILDEARTIKGKGAEMLKIYLDEESRRIRSAELGMTPRPTGPRGRAASRMDMAARTPARCEIEALPPWALASHD